jgi:NAD(P)-dependent dehydrogenase (short-subunit alcohol dehydrogenase family)
VTGGRLAEKVAIVTGASSGLGASFVQALAAEGARVVPTARRADRLDVLADSLGRDRVHPVVGDVADPGFPRALAEAAVERFGRLDILVNNAGVSHQAPAEAETTEDFVRVLAINLVAVFACSRDAFPHLKASGAGSIVNIGSALGLVGLGRIPQASYCASKGGVIALTRELSAQWAVHGVRVNCIAPGWFPSEMTDDLFADEKGQAFMSRMTVVGRAGRAGELDGAVVYLASDESSYVTGQTLAVDGGWTSV